MNSYRCGPCKMIAPELEYLSSIYTNTNFLKVDVDKAQEIAGSCGVQSMPTFMYFKSGELLSKFSGADSEMLSSLLIKFGGNITKEDAKMEQNIYELMENYPESFKILKSILLNIVNFPTETKFQKIKTTNQKIQTLLEKGKDVLLSSGFKIEGEFLVLSDMDKLKESNKTITSIENTSQKDYVFDSSDEECIFSNDYKMNLFINGKPYSCVSDYLKVNKKDYYNTLSQKFSNSKYALESLLKLRKRKIVCKGDDELGKYLNQIKSQFIQ